jgi:hypothetical protein
VEVAGVREQRGRVVALPRREEDDAVEALEVREDRTAGRPQPAERPRAADEVRVVHDVHRDEVRAAVARHEAGGRLAVGDREGALVADEPVEPVGIARPRRRPLPHGGAVVGEGGEEPLRPRRAAELVADGDGSVGADVLDEHRAARERVHAHLAAVGSGPRGDLLDLGPQQAMRHRARRRGRRAQVLVEVPQSDSRDELAVVFEPSAQVGVVGAGVERDDLDVTTRAAHERP